MKEKSKYVGSYQNTTVRLGQLVTGDHITSTKDSMLGIDGSKDMLVIMGAFSGFKAAYPMADKSAESTMEAIWLFKGDRKTDRFYSDRSGEIERALRELEIVLEQSQPGVPQNNAVEKDLCRMCLMVLELLLFVLAYTHAFGNLRADITAWLKISCLGESRRKLTGIDKAHGRRPTVRSSMDS